jgi:hypothetical protein
MRRALAASFALLAVGWLSGCGGGPSISSLGGTPQPNALNGQYAFLLSGFDASFNPTTIAGSFKADGMGHITGGAVDVNESGVITSSGATPLAGTYTFDANGQGIIGTITLTNHLGSLQLLKFGFSLQTSGLFGDIMDVSTNNFFVAGTVQQQVPSAFPFSTLAGDYALALNGINGGLPTSAIGRFTLQTNGVAIGATFDRSISGVNTAGPTIGTSASVAFAAAPDPNGRGTLTVTINDTLASSGTKNFVYYAITANRFIAIQTDTTGSMVAEASRQSTPFSAATVSTTQAGAVFGMAGIDTVASNEISAVGQLQIIGSNTSTLGWDSNDNGGIGGQGTLANQPVVFDPTTGRGKITVASGTANGLADTLVFYLTAQGTGFIMDATSGMTNRAMAGTLTAQTATSFSTASDLSGLALVRAKGSAGGDAQAFVGAFGPNSSSTYAFLADERDRFSSGTALDGSFVNLTVATLNASTGRGTLLIPTVSGNATEAFYVIGPNQFVFIDISPVSAGPNLNGASPLFFASPQ